MTITQIIALAIVQGLTEFLPISSSAHLILPAQILGWQDQGLAFDVAVHVGSLIAVLLHFRKDVWDIAVAWFKQFSAKEQTADSRLGWAIIIGTIPAGLAGVLFDDWISENLRSVAVIATTTIVFGLLLGFAERFAKVGQSVKSINLPHAVVIGLAQMLALVPGTSRSGITMTAALFLGYSKTAAARFSFLLSIPIIVAAGGWITKDLLGQHLTAQEWLELGLGTVMSAVAAWVCIKLFLQWIEKIGYWPFVAYRLILGAVLITLLLTGTVS